ncbi:MAG: DUF2339 domain-containing protein [Nevskia sp.]|nr:DUF2339 domain-containing protein [Nevskia sp.]
MQESKPGIWIVIAGALAGLILGGAVHTGGGGIFLWILLGAAIGELLRVQVRLRALESRVRDLADAAPAAPAAAPAPLWPIPPPAPRPQAATAAAAPMPGPTAAVRAPLPQPVPPAKAREPERGKARAGGLQDTVLAWLKGGNPLARAGVVILFFGGSFLAKYAAEHSLLPLELRLAALASGALVLLGLGWRLRRQRPVYAQTLQGGGVAGFYLTVFAATRLYQLLPHALALGLMIVVALTSAVLAVAQDALALAVIGTGGGFLAPILLSTGGGSLAALFTYYTVLNLGVFAVAWFRAWRVLNLVGLLFTFGVAGLFRAVSYGAGQRFTMDFFLLLFFAMYAAVTVLFSLRQKPDLKGYLSGSLVFGLPLLAFGLHASVMRDIPYALAWSALGFGAFYAAMALGLLRSRLDNLRPLAEAFAAMGVVFGSLAVPLAFDPRTTSALWAVEGAGVVWIGVRQQRRLARAFGLLLQLAGGCGYWIGLAHAQRELPVLNSPCIGALMLAVAGVQSGWWLFGNRERRAAYEAGFDLAALLWGLAWWFGGGLDEIERFGDGARHGAKLAFAAASLPFLLEFYGLRRAWPLALRAAAALLPLVALGGLLQSAAAGHPLVQAGWIGWPLLAAVSYRLLWRLEGTADALLRSVLTALHAGAVWLWLLVAAWEADWQAARLTGGVWHSLPWGLVPAAALWWLGRRPLRPQWPASQHEHSYRLLAAVPLALLGAVWILAVNLTSDGNPGGLPYLPLLNPLDLAVALLLVAGAGWWLALEPAQRGALTAQEPRLVPAAAAALAFLWLNAALVRALHYQAGTPLDGAGILRSTLVQAALSIFWGALGFAGMTWAARRAQREAWIAGAVLMAAVVIKLFLVDTAGRGTLARIASFITVGALLLLTGYLSPLPPRAKAAPGDEPGHKPGDQP